MTGEAWGAEFDGGESPTIVDKHRLSDLTGLTLKQIDVATRDGMPTHGERARGRSVMYRVPDCVQWLLERAGNAMEAAKQRQLEAVARKREAEASKMEGRLVDIETVEAAIRDGVAAWRSELLSLPARLPAEMQPAAKVEIESLINRLAIELPHVND